MTISIELLHNVNNKLQLIMGMADLAECETDPKKIRGYLQSIRKICRDTSFLLGNHVQRPSDKSDGM